MLKTPRDAIDFVRKHGVVTMTRSARPSFVEAVAGAPVKGSWWSHPKGRTIFFLAEALHDSKSILATKLVDGRVTFLHRSRWPALARVVLDREWRAAAASKLRPAARRLLRDVERRGSVRLEGVSRSIKEALEKSLLVHSGSVHTAGGSHATVLTSWEAIFDARTKGRAKKWSMDAARGELGFAAVP